MSELLELVKMSQAIGADPVYAQGGGGNTSLKLDATRMWIKVSGMELSKVSFTRGFVQVNYPLIAGGMPAMQNEADYIGLLEEARQLGEGRASMEAGFHAVLGRAVIHSHSLWLNIIACAEEGRAVLAKILPDAVWVDYATPGLPVMKAVAAHADAKILVLQNHGLIVSGANCTEALALHAAANDAAQNFLRWKEVFPLKRAPKHVADAAHLLFPDQAVYLAPGMQDTAAAQQTLLSYDYLREMIALNGLKPHYLPESEANTLVLLEAEKHRQKVAQACG